MANYLDANPEDAACIAHWRERGQFVPHCRDGVFMGGFNGRHLDWMKPDASITPEDYVVGLELLGFRLVVWRPIDELRLGRMESDQPIPPAWHAHAINIMWAFGSDRNEEAIAFLLERDGEGQW